MSPKNTVWNKNDLDIKKRLFSNSLVLIIIIIIIIVCAALAERIRNPEHYFFSFSFFFSTMVIKPKTITSGTPSGALCQLHKYASNRP